MIGKRRLEAGFLTLAIPLIFGAVFSASGLNFMLAGYARFSRSMALGLFGLPFFLIGSMLFRNGLIAIRLRPFIDLTEEDLSFTCDRIVVSMRLTEIERFAFSKSSFSVGTAPPMVVLKDGRAFEMPNLYGAWSLAETVVRNSDKSISMPSSGREDDARRLKVGIIIGLPLAILAFLIDRGFL